MAHTSRLGSPVLRLTVLTLLVLGSLLGSPAWTWAKGCAESLPGQSNQPPSSLWGDLRPEKVILDATTWTGSQAPTTRYPITTSIDIENDWIFQSFYGGFAIWDARTDPANPTRVAQVGGFEGQIPGWKPTGEFTQVIQYVDAPEGVDSIAVLGALPTLGVTIWDTTNKSGPRQLYQDLGKFVYQVYAARIGGRDYAFAGDFQSNTPGVHVYDMTAARSYTSGACAESTGAGDNHCGVYMGRIGDANATKYVSGLQVGGSHFLVTSGGDSTASGIKIWNVTNPGQAALVVQDFQSNGSTHGVAMWTHNDRHYLAARHTKGRPSQDLGKIFDITTCLTTGCSGLQSLELWQAGLKPYPESVYWLSATFSRNGSVPFVYFGNHDVCREAESPLQTEYLFDVSNPAAPSEVTPDGTIQDQGKTVDYWSWYYSDTVRGFAHLGPRMAKFNDSYLYRAAATMFDVHRYLGAAGPPLANFAWSPDPVYAGDLITFTSTSSGAPNIFNWSFQDGSPAAATANAAQVTFTSPGAKTVSLSVTNPQGTDGETKTITVIDPAPAVGNIVPSPASPLVCQPVTLTAENVTGKAPLAVSWTVLNGSNAQVASGTGNPFTWNSNGQGAGTYTVNVVVSKTGYPNATNSATVILNPLATLPPSQPFTPTNDPFVAGTVQFHVAVNGATEWKWDFGDGTPQVWTADPVAGPNPTHTYLAIGQKTVSVKVRNCVDQGPQSEGFASQPLTVDIQQIAPLKINLFQAQGCQVFCDFAPGATINFNIQVEGNPTEYQYDWNGDGTYEEVSPTVVTTHQYSQTGPYTPVLRLKRGAELSIPWVHQPTITILQGGGGPPPPPPPPPPGSVSISGPSSGQVGQALNFTASGNNCTLGSTVTWNAGSGGTVTGNSANVSITWSSAGSKTVTASSGDCTSGSKTVNISAGNTGGMTAQFTFTPALPAVNQVVSFDATSSTGNPVVYVWEFGDGGTALGPTATHAFSSGGTFNVKLTISKDCANGVCNTQTSTTKPVIVSTGPQVLASFDTSASCTSDITGERCEATTGQAVTFTSTGTGATSYLWNFDDGPTADGPQASHTWNNPGSYLVQLKASNGPTSATASRLFVVTGKPVVKIKSVVLPWIAQTRGALLQSSDLYVHNPGATAMDLTLEFRKKGAPESNPPRVARTIQPGATLYVGDVLRELFDRENIAGFISAIVDQGETEPVITSFNTTFSEGKEFGQTVSGVSMIDGSTAAATGPGENVQHLVGLIDNSERLAYFGISNPSDQPLTYRLRFFDKAGRQIAESTQDLMLSRFGQRQYQVQEIRDEFGITNLEDYRIEVEKKAGGQIVPYASNLRLSSEDPSFIGVGGARSSTVYLVGALSTPGLNNSLWQSDVLLSNVGSQPVTTDITFTSIGLNSTPTAPVRVTLQPGQTERLENVIGARLGINNAIGVLTITSTSGGVFPIVQGESYDNSDPEKRFGQSMRAVSDVEAAGPGKKHLLVGLRQDAENRTTFWIFNPDSAAAEYDVVYRALDGSVLGTTAGVRLGPGKMRQFSPAQHPLPAAGVKDGFTVQVVVKSGKALSAAQVINNLTNDPAYIQGEVR